MRINTTIMKRYHVYTVYVLLLKTKVPHLRDHEDALERNQHCCETQTKENERKIVVNHNLCK